MTRRDFGKTIAGLLVVVVVGIRSVKKQQRRSFTPFLEDGKWYYTAPNASPNPPTIFGPFDKFDDADWDATLCDAVWEPM